MKDTDNLVDYERIININRALMSRITPRPSLFFDIEGQNIVILIVNHVAVLHH